MATPRLHHFDILKGLAIFMVVMGHVLTMCIREIDSAVLFKYVERIHMPIFFFISGYFSFKLTEVGTIAMPKLVMRAKQLLLPFFVVSTLWIYYFPHSGLQSPLNSTWAGLYTDVWKNGYWFTLCLFEVIALYASITPVLTSCKTFLSRVMVVVISWLMLWQLTYTLIPTSISKLLSLPLVFEFYPVFMFGVLARSEKERFDQVVSSSSWVTAALLVGSVLMYYACWSWEFSFPIECLYVAKEILYLCVVVVAFSVVKTWCAASYTPVRPHGGLLARMWEYLGNHSLAIYLLHYFFLFPMGAVRTALVGMNLGIVPTMVVAGITAAAVIAVVLGANCVISRSKILTLLLTGSLK